VYIGSILEGGGGGGGGKIFFGGLKFHETPHTVYGLPRGILHVFYTKMSFKILKFSNRPSCQSSSRAIYLSTLTTTWLDPALQL
jgi:hypothetical protein